MKCIENQLPIDDSVKDLLVALSRPIFPLSNETVLQKEISRYLTEDCEIFHQREYRLSDTDIIDFLFDDGIGMEVKIKGQKSKILRQCNRYAQYHEIKAIILASSVPLSLPNEIDGTPCYYFNLSRAWI